MLDFNSNKVLYSFEVFPPKDSIGINEIYASLGRFKALSPDYISVTYGAGGSALGNTVEIASDLKNKFGIESMAHLTCIGSTKADIDKALFALKENGVDNILALRGDLPKDDNRKSDFVYATDLIEYIAKRGDFQLSAACYPEGHIESDSFDKDIEVLKMKADLGVSNFISQLFFDNDDFYRMLDAMEKKGIKASVQAGIMPIQNRNQILRMISLSGAKLPPKLSKIIARFEHNKEALMSAGINYAIEQIIDLLANGVKGIHIYAMNKPLTAEKITGEIKHMLGEV